MRSRGLQNTPSPSWHVDNIGDLWLASDAGLRGRIDLMSDRGRNDIRDVREERERRDRTEQFLVEDIRQLVALLGELGYM